MHSALGFLFPGPGLAFSPILTPPPASIPGLITPTQNDFFCQFMQTFMENYQNSLASAEP